MRTLLDTNVLLRSTQPTHPLAQVAGNAIDILLAQGDEVCLVSQNIYEYWVVCTRPAAQNGLGMTAAEAESKIGGHSIP